MKKILNYLLLLLKKRFYFQYLDFRFCILKFWYRCYVPHFSFSNCILHRSILFFKGSLIKYIQLVHYFYFVRFWEKAQVSQIISRYLRCQIPQYFRNGIYVQLCKLDKAIIIFFSRKTQYPYLNGSGIWFFEIFMHNQSIIVSSFYFLLQD